MPEPTPESPPESTNDALPPDWTLDVEGLGPITKAQIRPAKLTLLVGDNNSGKSYLATLLWGIQCRLVELLTGGSGRSLPVLGMDTTWVGEALAQTGMGRLLNRPDYAPTRIELKLPRLAGGAPSLPLDELFGPMLAEVTKRSRAVFTKAIKMREAIEAIAAVARQIGYSETGHSYLPASRTGFMLLRQQATQAALQRRHGIDELDAPKQRLSMPMLELMQTLVEGFEEKRGPFAAEADLLEASLGGALVQKRGEVGMPDYRYRPGGTDAELGLHATSSMVTELAPIILTLRYSQTLPFLVIEEPEAHLHPKIQRALARTLVRLVRRGVRLVITTHSDLFCQQINNCLKLGGRSAEERAALQEQLGYRPEEYLLDDEVRGYSFTNLPDGSGSEVRELAHTPYGLEMPSFIQELDRLMSETAALDRAIPVPTGESA